MQKYLWGFFFVYQNCIILDFLISLNGALDGIYKKSREHAAPGLGILFLLKATPYDIINKLFVTMF
jgi:hypothetical protein